ncbi:MAG: ribosome biogenesis GTPase Der [Legionellales bacterium]|nr:ribosome biogenesis GTPase Der [Legionellales bacterium]
MIPVIAIVGRPNVGKSTLFNCLTKSKDAIVADEPGVTRDRQFGDGAIGEKPYIVIDTGGIGHDEVGIDAQMADQSRLAAADADIILFVASAKDGLTAADEAIAKQLRTLNKPLFIAVNKIDGQDPDIAMSEFYGLGIESLSPVAAAHKRGINTLVETLLEDIETPVEELENPADQRIKIAVAGRPNVGKSTLINRFLNEERVVVYDQPGTTRDSIYINFDRGEDQYTFIDTAGVRKRARVTEAVEKFSVIKTLQAIKDAHVVILVVDAHDDITDQDLSLLGFVIETGKSLVIAINKWDGLEVEQKEWIKRNLSSRLRFASFAETFFISALHGTNVGHLYEPIKKAYASATQDLPTALLTRILEEAVKAHPPPLVNGRRIKLRYAHCGGHNPPIIVIHGNQTEDVPKSYLRYLEGVFRKAIKLYGTPIRILTKTAMNPFKGKRNTLTPRQQAKRKRLMKHIKKNSKK